MDYYYKKQHDWFFKAMIDVDYDKKDETALSIEANKNLTNKFMLNKKQVGVIISVLLNRITEEKIVLIFSGPFY